MEAFRDAYCAAPEPGVVERAAGIRLLALDVDGVLPDGAVYMAGDGEAFKRFHIHDGKGFALLREAGIATAIVTARRSTAVAERARELGISQLRQGVRDKGAEITALAAELELPTAACAFVGDDLVDLAAMARCGLAVAVADAAPRVQRRAHWVTARRGGNGAVREVCELVLAAGGLLQGLMDGHG
ncbi:MAG: HAD hydrolase family protein [Arhodomonas sp.]|nr:HAD hydrolase family protein [Arhodomonas sp.]